MKTFIIPILFLFSTFSFSQDSIFGIEFYKWTQNQGKENFTAMMVHLSQEKSVVRVLVNSPDEIVEYSSINLFIPASDGAFVQYVGESNSQKVIKGSGAATFYFDPLIFINEFSTTGQIQKSQVISLFADQHDKDDFHNTTQITPKSKEEYLQLLNSFYQPTDKLYPQLKKLIE